jgi:hypothetical protein
LHSGRVPEEVFDAQGSGLGPFELKGGVNVEFRFLDDALGNGFIIEALKHSIGIRGAVFGI